jgi:hypothetical protein
MLLCGAALSQLGWGERLQSADGTWRACLARSRRAGGGTRCPRAALPSASSAGESNCRARMTRGVLVSRDLNASGAAFVAALLFCPPPVRLGRATAERGRHMACSSQAIATRRLRRLMPPSGAALCHLGLGERLQCADGTCRARLARPRRAGGGTWCCLATLLSASAAGEDDCRAQTARGVLVSCDRDVPAFALSAAVRRCPPPARLARGRATAGRGRHLACSSPGPAIATRRRRRLVLPCGAALRQLGWEGRLQSADGTCLARLARSRRACGGT